MIKSLKLGDFLTLSNSLTHKEFPENRFLRTEIKPELAKLTENVRKEEISQPIPEPTILKAEIKPNLVKQTEITIEDEISQPIPEPTVLEAEIKPELVKQPELKPETEITPKKVKTKKKGLLNFKINRKIVSEKPIRSKIIKKKAKPQVPKKRCPFCGKEHDDLNVEFCYSCGYKF